MWGWGGWRETLKWKGETCLWGREAVGPQQAKAGDMPRGCPPPVTCSKLSPKRKRQKQSLANCCPDKRAQYLGLTRDTGLLTVED